GEIVVRIDGANVITALKIHARRQRRTESDAARIAVSTVNGLVWREIWRSDQVGEQSFDLQLVKEINGAYEALVKVSLLGGTRAADAQLHEIEFETTTMLNGKTQPILALGKNTIYVGAGEQTESIVFWPDQR